MNKLFGKQHTEIADINLEEVDISSNKSLINKYSELIIKCDKYTLGNYPLMIPPSSSNVKNIKISLDSIGPIESSELYKFGQSYIKKTTNGMKNIYIFSNKNKLHISHMERFNYPVIEVITGEKIIKPIIRFHKPTNVDELKQLLKPGYEIIPFVQIFKFMNQKSMSYYMTLHPIKFYVGKKLDEQTMEEVLPKKARVYVPKPKSDFYYSEESNIESIISADSLEEPLYAFPKNDYKSESVKEMNKQYDLDYYPNDLPELEEID